MRSSVVAIVSALFAAGALGAPESAKSPPPAPGELPGQYRVLLSRSIFSAKGRPDDAPADAAAKPADPTLSLTGVVQDDQRFTAFVEDVPHKQVLELKVGDPVAHGRVLAITLHELVYEAGGKKTRVAIGQPLSISTGPDALPSAPALASESQHRRHSAVADAR